MGTTLQRERGERGDGHHPHVEMVQRKVRSLTPDSPTTRSLTFNRSLSQTKKISKEFLYDRAMSNTTTFLVLFLYSF